MKEKRLARAERIKDAEPGMKFYCINCGKQFATYDEGKAHWAETYDAPINDIILKIKSGKPVKALGTSHEGMWDDYPNLSKKV